MAMTSFEPPHGLKEISPEPSQWQINSFDSDEETKDEFIVFRIPEGIHPQVLNGLEIDWPPKDGPIPIKSKNGAKGQDNLIHLLWDSQQASARFIPEAQRMYAMLPNQEEGGFKGMLCFMILEQG